MNSKMKSWMMTFLLLSSWTAVAAEDLTKDLNEVIQCHEALDGKSEGLTQKLGYDSATPIALVHGKDLYFATSSGIYILEGRDFDKGLLIHLKEQDKDFFRQMDLDKNGRITGMSFDEVQETKEAAEPKLSLNKESLELFKKDLVTRVASMTGEYQNKFDPKDTLAALKICEAVNFSDFRKSLEKQTTYYQEVQKNPSAYFQGLKKKRRSAEKSTN